MQYKHITMDRHTNLWSVVTSREEEKVMRLGRDSKGVSALFVMFY